jgi:hypothetical protein
MGVLDILKFNVWTITSLDPGIFLSLEGQFQPTGGAEDSAAPILSEAVTAGSDRPAVQWVAGGRRTVRIRSSFVSGHQLDDIRPSVDTLTALAAKDATLGRAPRVSFTWGELEIEGFCKVQTRIEGWWALSGWPRRVDFDLEIVEAFELDLDGSGTTGSGETQHVTLGEGETFEVLGLRYLGDPLRGELIRRENPDQAAGERPGDRVKILERSHPRMRGPVRPTAPSLLDLDATGDLATVLGALAADRGTSTRGMTWRRLAGSTTSRG